MASNITDLLKTLANSRVQKDNNALFQTIAGLIRALETVNGNVNKLVTNNNTNVNLSAQLDSFAEIMLLAGMGSNTQVASSTPSLSEDYVVMSDGVEPPTPVSDGFGNFTYITYTP